MTRIIYHICRAVEWAASARDGQYRGSDQDRADGFIHFSTGRQVEASARRHRAGQSGLVLVAVDADRLGDRLRWEPAKSGELYPHLYGPLAVAEALQVQPLPLGPDGAHQFPPLP
jgi:uncharacterized protein (DUF952 family)